MFFVCRCKMRQRDSRLFYLSMEVTVRKAGVKTVIALDDDARPAILQACHPKGDSRWVTKQMPRTENRQLAVNNVVYLWFCFLFLFLDVVWKRFCLQIKPGGLIRVHTSVLQPTSLYKSLFISEETTSDELLTLLLSCYSLDEPVEQFSLYEVRFMLKVLFFFLFLISSIWQQYTWLRCQISCVSSISLLTVSPRAILIKLKKFLFRPLQVCPIQEYQRKLHPDDLPLRAQQQRTQRGEQCHFIVRKNPLYPRRRPLLPPIVENKSTPPKADDEISNNRRFISASVCHKNCARELNYSRLARIPTANNLHDSQSHDENSIQNTSNSSFITTTYSPVYNIREIRTVCNSFSSLGIDKKLWDVECNHKTSAHLASLSAASRHSVAGVTTMASPMNIVREAVNNNPSKGYGSYVYI